MEGSTLLQGKCHLRAVYSVSITAFVFHVLMNFYAANAFSSDEVHEKIPSDSDILKVLSYNT